MCAKAYRYAESRHYRTLGWEARSILTLLVNQPIITSILPSHYQEKRLFELENYSVILGSGVSLALNRIFNTLTTFDSILSLVIGKPNSALV
jgi:hypothetical protein